MNDRLTSNPPSPERNASSSGDPDAFSPHPALTASLDAAIRSAANPSEEASPADESPGNRPDAGKEAAASADSAVQGKEEAGTKTGNAADQKEDDASGNMSLHDHLAELRRRLIRIFLFALGGFLIAYPFGKEIYDLLLIPLLKVLPVSSKLIYTAVPEAFFTYMKTAFIAGLFGASPLIFYQIWAFIAPGLYREEKTVILPLAVVSVVCFIGGGAFCFLVVLPLAFELFMSYTTDTVQALPTLHEYLSFVLHLLVPFGLIFEMPLATFFLARLGVISAARLRRARRYAILGIFIVAAILTPPDVFSQLLMAGPMLLLYEISILIAAFFGRPEKSPLPAETEKDDTPPPRQKTS
jgi:sec-independent protein translocase protein TatC